MTQLLKSVRLVGFKSFADRTLVEFGPGINAVVGPNGSGKSNLADALRWALGEQGRSLRTRRSEDVIFAGSAGRRAIGMADVTVAIDNADRLLPVDYDEIELTRRLYRSGESEYHLNRQRVRLRDLVELLDAANLADNAFLFIGQGMVDQALALRPEERRPLFEEAAGVRRHERRRRHAESELAEAESNLERVRDVLAELRPQARRLSAQVEQEEARTEAARELAEALVTAGRVRWSGASGRARAARETLDRARSAADAALGDLRAAELAVERLSLRLAADGEAEGRVRNELESQRLVTMELRLADARLAGELDALVHDRRRLDTELTAIARRRDESRLLLGEPLPEIDVDAVRERDAVEAELEAAVRELETARRAGHAGNERAGPDARREGTLDDQIAALRRRVEETRRQLADQRERAAAMVSRAEEAARQHRAAMDSIGRTRTAEEAAERSLTEARSTLEGREAALGARETRRQELGPELASAAARLRVLEGQVESGPESLRQAVAARGGAPLAEGLEVDAWARRAVEAALADAIHALVTDEETVANLRTETGTLLVPDGRVGSSAAPSGLDATADAGAEAAVAAAEVAGGGKLAASVRRDPSGGASRLLARTLWVPDLRGALALRSSLPPGWRAVTRAGQVVDATGLVTLAPPDPILERRAERELLTARRTELEREFAAVAAQADEARRERDAARRTADGARSALEKARRDRRIAEESERSASRLADRADRDRTWEEEQRSRLETTLSEAVTLLAEKEQQAAVERTTEPAASGGHEVARLAATVTALRARAGRVALLAADRERVRREAENARQRAEVTLAMDARRVAALEEEGSRLARRDADLRGERDRIARELAVATELEERLRRRLDEIAATSGDDRSRIVTEERNAAAARERLHDAEMSARAAEVSAIEERLRLDAIHEQLLVELAAIGHPGLEALWQSGRDAGASYAASGQAARRSIGDALADDLRAAMEVAISQWEGAAQSGAPEAMSPARLGALRRRFNELGSPNPHAATEYEALRARLDTLEGQRVDLEAAIRETRRLIVRLEELIAERFRTTFAALEGAFARRFRQLFDGGEAHLTLTTPDDLPATGVEITARPPGKRAQPLGMLSGGERALTAVALLLAMLEVRPVPFCVLDEVDAALDEANIARFAAAIRGLADSIQFVVITHNRGTIEAADALFGVTVGDDAVSRVVSLRLGGRPGSARTLDAAEASAASEPGDRSAGARVA